MLFLTGALALGIVSGCSNSSTDIAKKDDSKATAAAADSNDLWTYFNNTKWSQDFNGLKIEIEKVVTTDKSPMKDPKNSTSAVGVRFMLTNTTKDKFTIYQD